MIKIFLKNLPYTLTQPMHREFESKQRELQQWKQFSKSKRVKRYLMNDDIIEYLFALGIYYRYVIAPITRTGSFFNRLENISDAGLVVGGRNIDSKYRDSLEEAELHFHYVLEKYGLSERFFALTEIKQIVMTLINIDERRQDGQT